MFVTVNLRQRNVLPESLRKLVKSYKGRISDAAPQFSSASLRLSQSRPCWGCCFSGVPALVNTKPFYSEQGRWGLLCLKSEHLGVRHLTAQHCVILLILWVSAWSITETEYKYNSLYTQQNMRSITFRDLVVNW